VSSEPRNIDPDARMSQLLEAGDEGLGLLREDQPGRVWARCADLLDHRFGPRSMALVLGPPGAPELLFCHGGERPTVEWLADWPPWQGRRPPPLIAGADERGLRPSALAMVDELDAELWVPLFPDVRTVGLLSLGPRKDARGYDDGDRSFLQWLARHLEVALGNALRAQERREEHRRLDRSVHALSLLLDVSRAVTAAHQLQHVLELVLQGTIETVGAQKASLALFDPECDELRIHLVKGLPDRSLEDAINSGEHECMSFRPGEGIAGRVFLTRSPIRIDDTGRDDRFVDAHRSFADSILCVPLVTDGEAIGVINVTNPPRDRAFDAADEDHLMMLAAQAAGAINRARLYELASTDELTGLHVRRLILQRLKQEVRRWQRYGQHLSVAMLDLDHFKRVNDTHGHAAGDEVLRAVGRILREQLRRDLDLAGRFGGEEFMVLFPSTREGGAEVACERLRRAFADARIPVDGAELSVTVSIGLAGCERRRETALSLIKRADAALYRAKEGGRDRVCRADPLLDG